MTVPIYEFACLECRHVFDVFGGYAVREAVQVCPQCESRSTRPLFSRFAALSGEGESAAATSGGCACGGSCACSN